MRLRRRSSAVEPATGPELEGVCPISRIEARQFVTVVGQVVHMRAVPASGLPSLVVTVSDGSGTLTVRWSGRRAIGGVGLGRRVRLDGLPVRQGDRLELLNPSYTLLP